MTGRQLPVPLSNPSVIGDESRIHSASRASWTDVFCAASLAGFAPSEVRGIGRLATVGASIFGTFDPSDNA
jgi:hypothetical protein